MAFKRRLKFDKRIKFKKQMGIMYILLFVVLASLGVGYAYIRSDLSINGTAKVKNARWDIHFTNLNVTTGSVTAETAANITNDTTVEFAATLENPNDFYEFTVDVVNNSTLDAMIDSYSISPALTTEQKKYLEYKVTYSDGAKLAEKQELKVGATETLKVRFSYIENSDKTNYPTEDQTFTVEFNVAYTQADDTAIEIKHPQSLYSVLEDAATEGTYAKKYTGDHHDSFTEEPSKDIYYWYGSDDTNGTAILDKNNVIFAGFCWQMIRTTDTGGVKIVYNGVPSDGQCNNEGTAQQIGTSSFNPNYNSPAYVGYMYNPSTLITSKAYSAATSGSLFGTGVTYSSGTYTLTNTSTTYDTTHHYTCNNTTGTCSTVRYYYYDNYYIEISDGRTIEEALEDMLSADNVNQTNSTIKTAIDNWYQSNMASYTSKLEDTIFCNDRSISNLGGWNPDGGSVTTYLQFKNYSSNSDLSCTNVTDKFSTANTKAQLTYPVGLLTYPETYLLNNNNVRKTGQYYWLGSPFYFDYYRAFGRRVYSAGSNSDYFVDTSSGLRPSVSLATGTTYTSGSGSKSDPYVIE